MGHVSFANLDNVYKRITSEAVKNHGTGACTVLIFVTNDVDALCALNMLVTLFKSDYIAHKIVPVSGYTDLSTANSLHIEDNEELRSIILLNCGGLVDLSEMLSLNDEMTVYVCDSHRPLNLHGLFGSDQVLFMDDGDIDDLADLQQAFEELEEGGSESDNDNDDDEDDDDDGDDDDEDGVSDNDNDDEDKDKDEEEETDDANASPGRRRKRKRKRKPDESLDGPPLKKLRGSESRRRRKRLQRMIADYYAEGTYYGMSVAGLLYAMASQLGRAGNDFLWLSIIGLTYQYLSSRISHRRYLAVVQTYKDEVSKLNPLGSAITSDSNLDDLESLFGSSNPAANTATSRQRDDSSIKCDDELRLMLLRHWSFWEAMYCSGYVATRLGVWKECGERRLGNLLVKMGLPLEESSQKYTEMSLQYKKTIRKSLLAVAPRYNLHEIVFPSFVKSFGFKGVVSAADAVHSLAAILDMSSSTVESMIGGEDSDFNTSLSGGMGAIRREDKTGQVDKSEFDGLRGVGVGTRTGLVSTDGAALAGDPDEMGLANPVSGEEDERDWVRRFWVGYDALGSFKLLTHGIYLAMHLQKALVRACASILSKKLIQQLPNFQLCILSAGNSSELTDNEFGVFAEGERAMRLLQFLEEAMGVRGKGGAIVVAIEKTAKHGAKVDDPEAPDEEENDQGDAGWVVVGGGGGRKNMFGLAFQTAAQRTGARVKHDSFEMSVVEVEREDLEGFLESLRIYMR
ncbi:hypothetical protein HDU85_003104 [Gaertneriomyces sp. JEL0708]|nr:hypothetical protein HDU85_003104 [Gaertneriomyces sp. JEL0708]